MTFRVLFRMDGPHVNCRNAIYPFSQIARYSVPDHKVAWETDYEEYEPPDYTSPDVIDKPWADPDISNPSFNPNFNSLDTRTNPPIDRRSRMGLYSVIHKRPINPEGRTGLQGRGVLGKWGPNQAADPVVTRWKREKNLIVIHQKTSKPVLQFCAIQRRDTGHWAIPGGMVDPGEGVSQTLKREFAEEVLNILGKDKEKAKEIEKKVDDFFKNGTEVYKGYVDDHRNTDNAWMETVVFNFHDETGETVGLFPFEAGDDAAKVRWVDIDEKLKLYANHSKFIAAIAKMREAHL